MRKWIALLLALMMVCLCGCEDNNTHNEETTAPPAATTAPVQTTAPEMEMVELQLWVVSAGIWAESEAVDALLTEFNAYYPNIAVQVAYKTAADLSSGKPDIILANAEQISQWNAQGGMADLSDLWANGLQYDAYETVGTACSNGDDSYHTVPMCVIPYCMAVNQSILEEAEVMDYLNTVNHTWNTTSFLKAVQSLSDSGMKTVGTIYCKDLQEDALTRLMVTNLYDGTFLEKKTGTYTVAEDNMLKALTALAEQDGIRFDSSADAQTARARFLKGESAFVLNWNSALQVENASNSDILFMHYPSSDSRPETWAEVHGFGIFDNGDAVKVAASKTFVAFMSGNAAAIQATRNLPARETQKDAFDGTELEKTMDELNKLLNYLVEKESAGQYWETARNEWVQMLQGIASGGENWMEAVENAQKDLNSLFPELFPEESETTAPTE